MGPMALLVVEHTKVAVFYTTVASLPMLLGFTREGGVSSLSSDRLSVVNVKIIAYKPSTLRR